ncbi:hypothetical protein [Streptomyces chryseus]|uniref:hypothetical protein n=1 Tax=Streptomyces chryseus TaxID=68186 RepID=UPI00142EB463|nr:hypothetical protein [Streptomyces chryseus]
MSAQVLDVTDEGVNLDMGGDLILDVPCLGSYRDRKAGDWVVVRPGTSPLVVGRTGDDPGAIDETAIRALAKEVALDEQVVRAFTWGTGAPAGTGWQGPATALYFRKHSSGKVEVYGQVASETDPSPTAPTAPAPKAATITANSSGAWRGGSRDGSRDNPFQGDYTGRGNLRGGWFYGTKIADACAGKTVAKMTVTITRLRGSGANDRRPVHLYLHDYTSPPSGQLSLPTGPEDLLSLSVGATGTASLPASWRSALAGGSMRGLGVYYDGTRDYAAFSGTANIVITFS